MKRTILIIQSIIDCFLLLCMIAVGIEYLIGGNKDDLHVAIVVGASFLCWACISIGSIIRINLGENPSLLIGVGLKLLASWMCFGDMFIPDYPGIAILFWATGGIVFAIGYYVLHRMNQK